VTAAPAARRTTVAHDVPAVSTGPAAPRTSAGPAGGTAAPGVRTTVSGAQSDFLRPAAPGGRVTGSGGATRTTVSTTSWSG
jgi:hypothetical protein